MLPRQQKQRHIDLVRLAERQSDHRETETDTKYGNNEDPRLCYLATKLSVSVFMKVWLSKHHSG